MRDVDLLHVLLISVQSLRSVRAVGLAVHSTVRLRLLIGISSRASVAISFVMRAGYGSIQVIVHPLSCNGYVVGLLVQVSMRDSKLLILLGPVFQIGDSRVELLLRPAVVCLN